MTFKLLLFVAAMASLANAECPPMSDLPVMYTSSQFNCARTWYGVGGDHPIQGCNHCHLADEPFDDPDGLDFSSEEGKNFPVGSLMVLPGCTMYLFEDYDFGGRMYEFTSGTHSNVNGPWKAACADGFRYDLYTFR